MRFTRFLDFFCIRFPGIVLDDDSLLKVAVRVMPGPGTKDGSEAIGRQTWPTPEASLCRLRGLNKDYPYYPKQFDTLE